jgi:superfamily II DNA or RNA helicase
MSSDEIERIRNEYRKLKRENLLLRNKLGMSREQYPRDDGTANGGELTKASPVHRKIELFRSLFVGREDVYAVKWRNRKGVSGFSPACANEWKKGFCNKPMTKCGTCKHRQLKSLTDQVLYDHLVGKCVIGTYPLLIDETCRFLVIDLDGIEWMKDVTAFKESAAKLSIPVYTERSQSGKGAHIWIFFEECVSAVSARRLGTIILTRALDLGITPGFESYDRFFPNQDTMPKGGFGNLIALPLQKEARRQGNSEFVDDSLTPFDDQWSFLSAVKRCDRTRLKKAIAKAKEFEDPPASEKEPRSILYSNDRTSSRLSVCENGLNNKKKKCDVSILFRAQLYIKKKKLNHKQITRIMRMAAFKNPEFYRAQAMRISTCGKPRIINCSQNLPNVLVLPRGCLEGLLDYLAAEGFRTQLDDQRIVGKGIDAAFHGELTEEQKMVQDSLTRFDTGTLDAPPGFGKTVLAASMIAKRGVNTLVIVHRINLLQQWREKLSVFLNLQNRDIGIIGGGRKKRTGDIDIAMLPSLYHKGNTKKYIAEYGHVIVDECHHVPAFSFEQVMKKVRAKYVLGLTATPRRRDGHHPIIFMQCGPVRQRISSKKQVLTSGYKYIVIPRITSLEDIPENEPIQKIYSRIMKDEKRNDMIFDDILHELECGSSPLVLTERVEHLHLLQERLQGFAKNIIIMRGGFGKKRLKSIDEQIMSIPDHEERLVIATGRYVGEGFDDSRLDTLFLTMPIAWRGILQQYVGRLHRRHRGKNMVKVYDYVDVKVPVLQRMYEKRLLGYRSLGYEIREHHPEEPKDFESWRYVPLEED